MIQKHNSFGATVTGAWIHLHQQYTRAPAQACSQSCSCTLIYPTPLTHPVKVLSFHISSSARGCAGTELIRGPRIHGKSWTPHTGERGERVQHGRGIFPLSLSSIPIISFSFLVSCFFPFLFLSFHPHVCTYLRGQADCLTHSLNPLGFRVSESIFKKNKENKIWQNACVIKLRSLR